MKIGIIGGGASGLVTAIKSKTKNNEVTILERNSSCGKKILVTGNGRCNYWNDNQEISNYDSNNNELIGKIINKETEKEVIDFFKELVIVPKIKNGYWYPSTNQAITIKDALVDECLSREIIIKNDYLVNKIVKNNNKFIINDELEFDIIVLSTGSNTQKVTGSDGMGYNFLKEMNHNIIKPLPALVQLNTRKYNFLNKWKGIRTDVELTQIENGKEVRKESGEIQLTDYGISGICVFNLSLFITKGLEDNKKEEVEINFIPNIKINDLLNNNRSIRRVLDNIINKKIVEILLEESKIDGSKKYLELNDSEKTKLINILTRFNIEIISTKSFDSSQVSRGGLSLEDINMDTMESKVINNLYITGELLDITGICGGYNLGLCWRSAIKAGNSIRGKND
ncbi:MAG: aminoacetone oxidase family FAD-binding enzyme [Bacilli bacterium]|nr:aminoacetone oxidase family FAD-binding enzyme [Bacilli bacterium]